MESGLVELAEDIRRVTFPLPLGIDHVHCYLLRDGDGTWTIVDTGLGLPGAGEAWRAVLDELDAPVGRSSSPTSIPTTWALPRSSRS